MQKRILSSSILTREVDVDRADASAEFGRRMSASVSLPEIDEELYSRQIYVLGHEAMQKMATVAVLVSGMKGLGVEIAKNIILAGVKSVTVHDQNDAQWEDLSSQFYLSENDVGKNRAVVSRYHLAELNGHVNVQDSSEELSESFLSDFQVVVLTNSPLEEQQWISDFCHANSICFVLADTKGLAGQIFCDFGEHFVVHDPSEAEPVSAAIHDITQGNPGILTMACDNGQDDLFEDSDRVTFSEVEGMTELNGCNPRPIRVIGQNRYEVGDTSSFSPYKHGGIITQVKMPQSYSFRPLRASMAEPKIKTPHMRKLSRYHTLHRAFWALHKFKSEMTQLPRPRNQADADRLVELARTLPGSQEPLEEDLVQTFSYGCTGDLSPINSFIGAVTAQEVLKAASGKFTPLDQWLYFDAFECLPEKEHAVQLTEETCAPHGKRYDGQVAIFGADFQEQLGKQKYFVVGAGAIGCELLKNFAMIGLAAGKGGNITVTDMDSIEKSNLNRQFLFRPWNESKQKSEVAAAAIKLMNPHVSVTAQQHQVGADTECIYGDEFFLGLDGVANALDSMKAREYVAERCERYLKPLLDSGTEGTRGHVQVVVPHLTDLYGHSQDVDEKAYPLCTLRYFPSTIQHTVQWARDQFEGLFKTTAETINKFLMDPSFLETQEVEALEMLEQVQINLQNKPRSWEHCVVWARSLWERIFSHGVQQLLHNFPPKYSHSGSQHFILQGLLALFQPLDSGVSFLELLSFILYCFLIGSICLCPQKTSTGLPFWSGSKRCPQLLSFDCNNTTHITFILAASHLFAQTHQLVVSEDKSVAHQVLLDLHLPPFQPCHGLRIPLNDQEMQVSQGTIDEKKLAELRQELTKLKQELEKQNALWSHCMKPIHFNKGDTSHFDFIMTAANLRAENYNISQVETFQMKKIVDRIIPAIATTTAAVAGLVCLELYKLVWKHKNLHSYRSSFLQLSEPQLNRYQPLPPPPAYKYRSMTWSCWDRIEVPGINVKGEEITLRDLYVHLQKECGLVPQMLLYKEAMLYAGFWDGSKRQQHLSSRLTELVCYVTGQTVAKDCRLLVLTIVCEDEEDDNDLPPIHVQLQPVNSKK